MRELLISRVPLFASLRPEEQAVLAATLPTGAYPAGRVLFREGDHGERFYIVLVGRVAIIKALGTPDERLLDTRGAGEFVGEMSLLVADGRRTASVRVEQDAQMLELTRADFDALLRRHPTLAYTMLQVLSDRLRFSHDTSLRDLRERNERLASAYAELQAAQEQLVAKQALERELLLAREIQENLLPRDLLRLRDYDIGARMVSAQEVAGDFFDLIPLGQGRLGLVVGDVCGKGVPAALVMALTRALLRATAGHHRLPEQTLRDVNRHMQDISVATPFVTAVYGVLDQNSGTFSYARAGHELPLRWDAAGMLFDPVMGLGHPLGMLPEPAIDVQTVTMPPGGTLLLYSDGVTEATDATGDFFGRERLSAAVAEARAGTAQELCDWLIAALARFRGTAPQADDITLVAVRALTSP